MGKKGSHWKGQNGCNWTPKLVTLREESLGKKQTNASAKALLKVRHIKNIAKWATVEASIPSLGAFFGHRLADSTEALGISADSSLFTCQRCESILQVGCNCSVRIENNRVKVQRRCKKSKAAFQNNVVYKCDFCSYPNLIRGTPRGHLKELYPPRDKARPKVESVNSKLTKPSLPERDSLEDAVGNEKCEVYLRRDTMYIAEGAMSDVLKDNTNNPATPLVRSGLTLLEARSKKRSRSKSRKATELESSSTTLEAEKSVSTSNKRKRKSWTSLKEMAESSDNANIRNLTNLHVSFKCFFV